MNHGEPPLPGELSLSVFICTRHRPSELRRCLQSISAADRLPDQVVVSDDGDQGKTVEDTVRAFAFAIYQRGPRSGLAANRNACLAVATSSHIIFDDDDVTFPPDFFSIAHKLCSQSQASAGGALISGVEYKHLGSEVVIVRPGDADFWGYQRIVADGPTCRAIVINASIFPASLFRVAQFDPVLHYGSDEIDIAHHAIKLGYQIVFEPSLFVNHYPSEINRNEYASLVDASRIYATAKDYWSYQRRPGKALLFCLLAPLKLAFGLGRRYGLPGIVTAVRATAKALRYGQRTLSSRKRGERGAAVSSVRRDMHKSEQR